MGIFMLMLKRVMGLLVLLLSVALVGCSGATVQDESGPRLMSEALLEPTTPAPTRFLSATPTREPIATEEATMPMLEVLSPLEEITIEADFVLVTPTLPPSKTPTDTPTVTLTPTESPSPTFTVTATATMPAFPTSVIVPVTAPVVMPQPQICDSAWFFIEPRPASCPLSPPMSSQGVFQTFENGYMVWVGSQRAIYVMYNDNASPRWQVFRDQFQEGMQEDDPAYANGPRSNVWQPRRGFGMLWRDNAAVRDRIGWATDEWEIPFSVQTQTAPEGTLFVSDATGSVFSLLPNGMDWMRYRGYSGF